MANPEHLAILKRGVEVWNEWRKETHPLDPDFTKADLLKANLCGVHFGGADLSEVDLREANLDEAYLGGADLTGAILTGAQLKGAYLGGAQLRGTDMRVAVLTNADLKMAHLTGANFEMADLEGANLSEARIFSTNLQGAILRGVNLGAADLIEARLDYADLSFVDFEETRLTRTMLRGVNLFKARFNRTDLVGTDFNSAITSFTVFADVDLSMVKGLESIRHTAPSVVDIPTIYRSNGKIPEVFLRGCGVPENFIAFMRSLTGKTFGFYSCFISHSVKDEQFCERLYANLQAKGVRVWYFPEDAKWGETVWGEIDRSIKVYDKLIVVCSENSLQSGPVNREIERALSREDKEGKNILFPIRIDDYIFEKWEHERKADVVRKVVGDFSGWDKDAAKYDKAFDKLLKGLQAG
jgi:uncharacterized protein YjbI with pentapeptide repeats